MAAQDRAHFCTESFLHTEALNTVAFTSRLHATYTAGAKPTQSCRAHLQQQQQQLIYAEEGARRPGFTLTFFMGQTMLA